MVQEDIRRHPRHELEFVVEYSVLSGSGMLKLIKSRTLDFSISGARIETEEELKAKDKLTARIELPDLNAFEVDQDGKKTYKNTVVTCFGMVRWVRQADSGQFNAGIRFSGISVRDHEYITKLLDEIEKSSGH
ncbi:MAG TPA: PilZ domain-containing protein [archaeon]|nr:PilZ domain-containing protein [archaeon]